VPVFGPDHAGKRRADLLVKMVAPLPSVNDPLGYLFWCAVQDFLFFALVQKNLQERVPGPVAVLVTALLFGLSHYPYGIFMAGRAGERAVGLRVPAHELAGAGVAVALDDGADSAQLRQLRQGACGKRFPGRTACQQALHKMKSVNSQ
jgi:hypothetical protein